MKNYTRFAVYYAPKPGAFADFTAAWLGWDPVAGTPAPHPDLPDLPMPVDEISATPRKYGFHGTLKPPMRLAEGSSRAALEADLEALTARLAPVQMPGLALHRLGGFLALTPEGDNSELAALAAEVVKSLDHHRAPAPEAELARRRKAGLTARQEDYLLTWGYPYVLEEFQFHLTLSGKLPTDTADAVAGVLEPLLEPLLPTPFVVDDLCLFGEDEEGMFHLIHRYALSG